MARFRFSIRLLFGVTLFVACATALIVAYGRNLLWASSRVAAPSYAAMREHSLEGVGLGEELAICRFQRLRFTLPRSMAGNPRVFRDVNGAWLTFEDKQRQVQLPLTAPKMRSLLEPPPRELNSAATPALLKCIATSSTADFSMSMTALDLARHDWALAQREALRLDQLRFDRFAVRSADRLELILLSTDPSVVDSKRRVRSVLWWSALDGQEEGSLWFGDANRSKAGWIDAVAASLEIVPDASPATLTPADLSLLTNDQLLNLLEVGPEKKSLTSE